MNMMNQLPLNNARLWNTGLGCNSGIDITDKEIVKAKDFPS